MPKYYLASTTRIALRKYVIPQSMEVEYLLGDHLGSTALTTDAAGKKVSEMRYTPWGEVRYAWKDPGLDTTPAYALTRWTFTGQYSYANDPSTEGVEEFGLMYFNARWVDVELGRFAQADSIIPGAGDPQAWDRYAFVNNNPLNYIDPTGHFGQCHGNQSGYQCKITQNKVAALERQWAAERAGRVAAEQAAQGRASLGDFFNCRNLICDSGAEPGTQRASTTPFLCSSSICDLGRANQLVSRGMDISKIAEGAALILVVDVLVVLPVAVGLTAFAPELEIAMLLTEAWSWPLAGAVIALNVYGFSLIREGITGKVDVE